MGKNSTVKSVLVIVGEKSGEEHFLSFFDQLKEKLKDFQFYGVGGDSMEQRGVELTHHLKDFGSIGFTEVVAKIPFYLKASRELLKEVEKRETKVAILVDFQEFNFQIAKRLKKRGVEILYFVAPQAWAWRSYRGKILGKMVNTLFTLFPFEKEYFKKRGVKDVVSILHPVLKSFKKDLEHFHNELADKRSETLEKLKLRKIRVLLLPGSRLSEVKELFPIFLESADHLKRESEFEFEFALVKADSFSLTFFDQYLEGNRIVNHFFQSSELSKALIWADFCIASSGTVTLSCGLFEVPTIVCYKISKITSVIYGLIVKYQGPVSLPNIVLQKIVFPELLQENVRPIFISKILQYLLTEEGVYEKIKSELLRISQELSGDKELPHEVMAKVALGSYEENH